MKKVDEEGTVAAAAVAAMMKAKMMTKNPYFNFNRPFLFAVQDRVTNSILFIARVDNPLSK